VSELDSVLRDFLKTSRSMETNIVSVISDSNRDIEMILKELLIYLDATSKNLEKVQGSITKFVVDYTTDQKPEIIIKELSGVVTTIKEYHTKITTIDVKNTDRILEFIKLVGTTNQRFLKQILAVVGEITEKVNAYDPRFISNGNDLTEIKNILKVIISEVKDTKVNVSKNQDNLMTVIENMMDTSVKRVTSTENVEVQKIKSDEEKAKAKIALIGKIIGILLGSGGMIYLLIDVIIKGGK